MLRYIVMATAPYENMWPPESAGLDDDFPLPTFPPREAAQAWATAIGLRSPKGRRDDSEILAVGI